MADSTRETDTAQARDSRPFLRTTTFAYALAGTIYVALFLTLLILFVF